jgi:putative ABC transport system permease protein
MRWLGRRDRDYREELEAHIEIEVRENLDRGMAPEEARQAALRAFGNALAVRERLGDGRPLHFRQDLYGDVRYGLRLLRRNPGLTAAVVLTLALAIGANTAIFSLVDAVLLRMLPVRDPQSLVMVRALMRTGKPDWFSHTDYEWVRDHNPVFSGVAASMVWHQNLDAGDHKERATFFLASGNYFAVLGVEPAAGRLFTAEDDSQGRAVAVLSYGYWQRAFGGRADAVGKKLRLERTALEIVGVAPRGFKGEYDYGENYAPEFWVPLSAQPAVSTPPTSFLRTRNISWLGVVGRLRPGIRMAQAQAAMRPLLDALRADLHVDPQNDYLGGIGIEPGSGGISGMREQYGEALRLLMVLVAIMLLIACANVANLLLARSAARRREFAVRLALGAGRARVVRQLLTESLLLAGMACAAGLGIGHVIVRGFVAVSDTKGFEVHINLAVLAFAVTISCAAAVVFGLAPALQSNRIDPWAALKESRIGGAAARWFSPTRLLVVAQTGLSMVLLIASGLLLRTFLNLKAVNPGFDERVLQAGLDNALVSENGSDLGARLVERLSSIQGVQAVSYSKFGFGGSGRSCCMTPEGYTPAADEDKNVRTQSVSPGYFRTMGIAMLAGRDFWDADRKNPPPVAIVNETMARHYFAGGSAVGKRFSWSAKGLKDTEIIGVVKDAKYGNLRQATPRMVYSPALRNGTDSNILEIRAQANGGRPLPAIVGDCRTAIRAINPNIRITSFDTLAAEVDRSLTPERLVSWLAAGFGMVALLLTSVGLYGILAYTVARRTSEFGIRMALGAGRAAILQMVLREGLVLVGIGLALGFVAAVSLSHLVASLLFGVEAHDTVTFAAAAVTLAVVAAAASYGPARRATAIEPVRALRYE